MINVGTFGARGNGVADDYPAIAAANTYLASIGGGQLFFPAGHYKLISGSIIMENNIHYFGEGAASWLESPSGNTFLSGSYGTNHWRDGSLTYYPANDLVPGNKVVATTPSDASHFSPGQMITIQSVATEIAGLPYFIETNVVHSVDPSTGIITVEDPILDGYTGVQIAPIYSGPASGAPSGVGLFARDSTISDLRLSSSVTANSAFMKGAVYRCVVRNCIMHDYVEIIVNNSLVRFRMHDCRHTSGMVPVGSTRSVIEISTGSHEVDIYDNVFNWTNPTGETTGLSTSWGGMDEYSRRVAWRRNKFLAAGIDMSQTLFSGSGASGTILEDNEFVLGKCQRLINVIYPNDTNLQSQILNLPQRYLRNYYDCRGGFGIGIAIDGNALGSLSNLMFDGIFVQGAASDPYSGGSMNSIRFTTVPGSNDIFNNCHIDGTQQYDAGPGTVLIKNSEVG